MTSLPAAHERRSGTGRVRNALDAAQQWLFGAETGGRLRAIQLGLALILGLRIALGPYTGLAGQPSALFKPVWFLSWLPSMPSVQVIVGIQVVGTLAAALAVVGWRTRYTFPVAWASLLVLAGLRASRGKFMHNDLTLLLVGVLFLAAPVGVRLLSGRVSVRYGWPVRGAIATLASVYFLTGFQKVVSSGPAWVFSDNMQNVMYQAVLTHRAPTDAVALFIAHHALVAQLVAASTLVFELGFPLVIWKAWLRPVFALAAVAFHTAIYLTHGLDYTAWAATAVVVLVDWSRLARWVARRRTGSSLPATA